MRILTEVPIIPPAHVRMRIPRWRRKGPTSCPWIVVPYLSKDSSKAPPDNEEVCPNDTLDKIAKFLRDKSAIDDKRESLLKMYRSYNNTQEELDLLVLAAHNHGLHL